PDDKILSTDQCLWSALSGYLEPLISFSSNTSDRLWSYLTCAVDSILDETLIKYHDIKNSEILDFKKDDDEIPKDIESIFSEIKNYDPSPYFGVYLYLSTNRLSEAIEFMRDSIRSDEEPQPHKIRFFAHLVVLLKRGSFEHD
uniref:Nuclear pore complex protein n=1 Tax=Acrobeloides nanus TaxID=290746 RepID=A0A914D852_9BILA